MSPKPPSDLVLSAHHLHLAEDTEARAAESLECPVGHGHQRRLSERMKGGFRLTEGEAEGESLAHRSQKGWSQK